MVAIRGIVKRSEKRAYLIFYDTKGVLRVIRLADMPACTNGQTFTLSGFFDRGRFRVARALPHRYPRAVV